MSQREKNIFFPRQAGLRTLLAVILLFGTLNVRLNQIWTNL